ncbi:unnamed protein product [Schistocephalus solidus]|uniref:C2H2-type domain-containing protein n=1 Tax=Schistocephalus solidus TaxID=70667 RepID=A0A183TBD6_SCHSO|nr:unnamed protein product [Schistocephalus solidus]
MDTVKTTLKQLQLHPANWEDLARNRLAWRRTAKTGAEIYEENRIGTAKVARTARKSTAPRTKTTNPQALPKCPCCQRTFRTRISLVRHLRSQGNNSNFFQPSFRPNMVIHDKNFNIPTIIATTSQYSSPVTYTTITTTVGAAITTTTPSDGALS